MNEIKKHDYWFLVLLTIFFLGLIVFGQIGGNLITEKLFNLTTISVPKAVGITLICISMTLIMFFLSNKFFEKLNFKKIEKLNLDKELFEHFLKTLVILVILILPSAFYFYITTGEISELLFFSSITLATLIYMLSPALMEEFLFRGFLLNFFKQKNKKYLGLILTSSFFGVLHLFNYFVGNPVPIFELISITSAGFLLGLIYLNFGLFPVIIFHYFWNVLAMNYEGEILPTILIIIISLFLYLKLENKLIFKKNLNEKHERGNLQ